MANEGNNSLFIGVADPKMFHVILSGDYWEGGTAQRPEHRWNANAQKLSALVRRCFFFRVVVFFEHFYGKEQLRLKEMMCHQKYTNRFPPLMPPFLS